MRYNGMMVSHFAGFPVVHSFPDPHRGRTVNVYDVNDDQVLGVSDGVDAWMVSRSGSIDGRPCEQLKATGEQRAAKKARVRVAVDDAPTSPSEPTRRRATLLV